MSELSSWDVFGKYYGFPQCCIAAFNDGLHLKDRVSRKLSGTGYIPCSSCNKKTESELLQAIRERRIAPEEFPNEPDFDNTVASILASHHFTDHEKTLIKEHYEHNSKDDDGSMDIFDVIDHYFSICTDLEAIALGDILDDIYSMFSNESFVQERLTQVIEILKTKPETVKLLSEIGY